MAVRPSSQGINGGRDDRDFTDQGMIDTETWDAHFAGTISSFYELYSGKPSRRATSSALNKQSAVLKRRF